MGIAACDLSQHVIRPTLLYLQRHSATAEARSEERRVGKE